MTLGMRRLSTVLAVAAALTLVLAACSKKTTGGGGAGASDCDSTTKVCVTEKDFAISSTPTSKDAGSVEMSVLNTGPSTHEFVVFKTDLAPDALPTNADGSVVEEDAKGVDLIGEIEDIAANSVQSKSMQLESGKYVFICNLPGHYKLGMYEGFTVS